DIGDVAAQGRHTESQLLVRLGMLLRQPRRDDVHFGLRLLHGDARFETRHGEMVVAGPGLKVFRVDRQWRPDLDIAGRILEFRAHYSDYGMGKILQADRLPDDVRVSRVA